MISKMIGFEHNMNLILPGFGVRVFGQGFTIQDLTPKIQVKAAANWLKQVIQESTGKNFDVKKVVLFPGWFIEPTAEARQSDVWVLNPKALPAFIANSREQLSGEDLGLVASHLSRFVRVAGN